MSEDEDSFVYIEHVETDEKSTEILRQLNNYRTSKTKRKMTHVPQDCVFSDLWLEEADLVGKFDEDKRALSLSEGSSFKLSFASSPPKDSDKSSTKVFKKPWNIYLKDHLES